VVRRASHSFAVGPGSSAQRGLRAAGRAARPGRVRTLACPPSPCGGACGPPPSPPPPPGPVRPQAPPGPKPVRLQPAGRTQPDAPGDRQRGVATANDADRCARPPATGEPRRRRAVCAAEPHPAPQRAEEGEGEGVGGAPGARPPPRPPAGLRPLIAARRRRRRPLGEHRRPRTILWCHRNPDRTSERRVLRAVASTRRFRDLAPPPAREWRAPRPPTVRSWPQACFWRCSAPRPAPRRPSRAATAVAAARAALAPAPAPARVAGAQGAGPTTAHVRGGGRAGWVTDGRRWRGGGGGQGGGGRGRSRAPPSPTARPLAPSFPSRPLRLHL
jgi:hypothetical protein